jgi:enolase
MLELDGTKNKSNLGANAILAVSMAVCRTAAISKKIPLYKYISDISKSNNKNISRAFFNIIYGGVHAGNKIAFQEFMISPNLEDFEENFRAASEVYQILKKNLKRDFGGAATLLGDEGGFAPNNFNRAEDAMNKIMEAIFDAGYENKIDIALDVAASEFYENGKYNLGFKMTKEEEITFSTFNKNKSSEEMIEYYLKLVEKYPIISIEDPFDQNDFESFSELLKRLDGKNVQVVADDLTVTNPERIKKAIENKSANSLLLKINQIGTITESIEAFNLAKSDN